VPGVVVMVFVVLESTVVWVATVPRCLPTKSQMRRRSTIRPMIHGQTLRPCFG